MGGFSRPKSHFNDVKPAVQQSLGQRDGIRLLIEDGDTYKSFVKNELHSSICASKAAV